MVGFVKAFGVAAFVAIGAGSAHASVVVPTGSGWTLTAYSSSNPASERFESPRSARQRCHRYKRSSLGCLSPVRSGSRRRELPLKASTNPVQMVFTPSLPDPLIWPLAQ